MASNIGTFLKEILPKQHQWKITLFRGWDEIIGPLKGKVKIEKLEDGLIVLGVSHPAWAQELYMLSNVIKNKINALLKEDKIKNIRFRTTGFKPNKKKPVPLMSQYKSPQNYEIVEFNASEKANLNKIKRDDLRSALEQYYIRCKRRKKESTSARTKL